MNDAGKLKFDGGCVYSVTGGGAVVVEPRASFAVRHFDFESSLHSHGMGQIHEANTSPEKLPSNLLHRD